MVKLAPHLQEEVKRLDEQRRTRPNHTSMANRSLDMGSQYRQSLSRNRTYESYDNRPSSTGLERNMSFVPPATAYKPYKKDE